MTPQRGWPAGWALMAGFSIQMAGHGAKRSLFESAESKDTPSSINVCQEIQPSINILMPPEYGEIVHQPSVRLDADDCPPLPNLTIQNCFSDESPYSSSQVSGDVRPACVPSAGKADNRSTITHETSSIVVESSDADGDDDRQSEVLHIREEDQLSEKLAPIFRMGRRKTEDKGPQQPPKKVKKQKKEKTSAPNPEGLTARKLTGSKRAAGKADETVDLSCNLGAVVAFSPGSKKRRNSPVRSTSPKRSRSPSPDPATPHFVKRPMSGASKLLISRSSQGEHSDKILLDPSDCAPFSQLVHIQQLSDSERHWCQLVIPTHCACEDAGTQRGSSTTTNPALSPQVGDGRLPLLLGNTRPQLSNRILPKALEQLDALQKSHPSLDMHRLFTKCVAATGGVYTSQMALSESALPKPHGHEHSLPKESQPVQQRNQKRKKKRKQQSASVTDALELKCSINIQQIRVGDKKMLLARSISPPAQLSDGAVGGTTSEGAVTPVAASASVEEGVDSAAVVNLCSPEPGLPSCGVSSRASNQRTLASEEAILPETVQSFEHWSSALAPQKAADVLGNSGAMLAIMAWLQHWKKRMQPATTTGKMPATAQTAGGKRNGSAKVTLLDTSDSDFESPKKRTRHARARKRQRMDDSDSDWFADEEQEEDEEQCKVLLLLGPPGSGKTAAVYACAQELGYKVLEMNASSQRSRSQVMSHLMEASLSHQVAKTSSTLSNFFSPSTQPKDQCPTQGNKSKPARKGIASFFKTIGTKDSTDKDKLRSDGDVSKTLGKEATPAKPNCANVHLAKTGLILLEDVDVLFDDHDGGFWSSVYDVIEASKKPIIMTTSDETLDPGCDYRRVIFSTPSSTDLSMYLQVLALSKGLQLSEVESRAMADLQHGDIRRCIMSAQLWFSSVTNNTQACGVRGKSEMEPVPLSEENALLSSEQQDGRTDVPSSVTWFLTKQLGVEVYSGTGSVCGRGGSNSSLVLSVDAAHLCAQKHSAMQQQGVDVIYPLYEEQLRRMGHSKKEKKEVSLCSLPTEQADGSLADVTVKEQLRSLLWCSSQMSSLDVISDACSKWHSHPSNVTPWWSAREQDSLMDDHRDTAVDSQVLSEIRTLGDVLLLDLAKSRAALLGTAAQVDTLTDLGSLDALSSSIALRHTLDTTMQQQQGSWESCSPLFSWHHFVSRRAVSLDLLPWLRNMCATECRRKEARLKRRYRHYFHCAPVKEDVLNALPLNSLT